MAVSSGRCRIKKMTEVREYFKVGEVFEYSPVTEPNTCVLFEVVENRDSDFILGCDLCSLRRWCDSESNQVEMEDGSMSPFIPNCLPRFRSDEKDVYFKKI
jgi:hypothetical protein